MLFDIECSHKQENEDRIPELLDRLCNVLRAHPGVASLPLRRCPDDHRGNQARWSIDGQTITYMGIQLHTQELLKLIEFEYRQVNSILIDELLFGADDIAPIDAFETSSGWLCGAMPKRDTLVAGSRRSLDVGRRHRRCNSVHAVRHRHRVLCGVLHGPRRIGGHVAWAEPIAASDAPFSCRTALQKEVRNWRNMRS